MDAGTREHRQPRLARSACIGPPGERRCPTLVVAGEHDVPFMTDSCRSLAAAVPGARFELVGGAAHLPPMERPGVFGSLLLDFLGSVP